MQHITLGRSGLDVSRIAFGTWQLGGDWGPTDRAEAIAAIRQAADAGVTFFDTAQAYGFGASEQILGDALAVLPREEVVIATKGGLRQTAKGLVRDSSAKWIREGVEASLEALGTDYVDLFQLHWPDPDVPFEETADALAKLVADGQVLHVGVSNFDAAQMHRFSETLAVETLQPPYHLFRRNVEDGVLPYAAEHDIGVLVYGPLADGLLSGGLHVSTRFASGDWRAKSPMFRGDPYRINLDVVARLSPSPTSWASRCLSWPSRGYWPIRRSTSRSSAPEAPRTSTRRLRPPRYSSTRPRCAGSRTSSATPFRFLVPRPNRSERRRP